MMPAMGKQFVRDEYQFAFMMIVPVMYWYPADDYLELGKVKFIILRNKYTVYSFIISLC